MHKGKEKLIQYSVYLLCTSCTIIIVIIINNNNNCRLTDGGAGGERGKYATPCIREAGELSGRGKCPGEYVRGHIEVICRGEVSASRFSYRQSQFVDF